MTDKTEPTGAQPEILIVEDSPLEAELLRRCLDKAGYRITVAKNGEEGLQAARARRPALVVSDINMPVMNGYALCRGIKYDEVLWNIPVILLTSLSEPENIIQAINAGTDSYITQPFVEASLLERVIPCWPRRSAGGGPKSGAGRRWSTTASPTPSLAAASKY